MAISAVAGKKVEKKSRKISIFLKIEKTYYALQLAGLIAGISATITVKSNWNRIAKTPTVHTIFSFVIFVRKVVKFALLKILSFYFRNSHHF